MTCTATEIQARIEACVSHLCFEYRGKSGVVDPYYVKDEGYFFPVLYDGEECVVRTVDEVMNTPFFDGHTLTEIAGDIEITEW